MNRGTGGGGAESGGDPPNGILLVDKADGWTSHDVVARSRRLLRTRKIGHAGTLDPMATGLLVLGVGASTRLLTHLVGLDKEYRATLRLGIATLSDDREGETVDTADPALVADLAAHPARIRRAAADLTGAIEQAPSAVSAIKVDGRRAYDRVRAGETVELALRPVVIHRFELGEPRPALGPSGERVIDIDARIRCSSGSYVRALARDLGAALGVFGHLTALRRTAVGPFDVSEARPLDRLDAEDAEAAEGGEGSAPGLLDPAGVAARLFPVLRLDDGQARDLGHGKRLEVTAPDAPLAAALGPSERLLGLVEVSGGRTRVVTNFPVPASGDGPHDPASALETTE